MESQIAKRGSIARSPNDCLPCKMKLGVNEGIKIVAGPVYL